MSNKHRDSHIDETNRVRQLERHERTVSRRAHRRAIAPLRQGIAHEFQSPVPCRYTPGRFVDHLETPGSWSTDWEGCTV